MPEERAITKAEAIDRLAERAWDALAEVVKLAYPELATEDEVADRVGELYHPIEGLVTERLDSRLWLLSQHFPGFEKAIQGLWFSHCARDDGTAECDCF
jgi:hypothetical protein